MNSDSNTSHTRCKQCRKKTLMIAECKCNYTFCLKCRMPEYHNCTFNFKEQGDQQLKNQMPIIVGKKIDKI